LKANGEVLRNGQLKRWWCFAKWLDCFIPLSWLQD